MVDTSTSFLTKTRWGSCRYIFFDGKNDENISIFYVQSWPDTINIQIVGKLCNDEHVFFMNSQVCEEMVW